MPLNVELINKVCQKILETPKSFNMDYWQSLVSKTSEIPCGLICCFGGWVANVSGEQFVGTDQVEKLLGIGHREGDQLFYVINWPCKFQDRYYEAETPEEKAQIAVERFQHFIKNYKEPNINAYSESRS